jgi:hypothetical protein
MAFINISKKPTSTIHANNSAFYEEIAHVTQREPGRLLACDQQPWWTHEPRRPAPTLPRPN